VVLGVLPLDTLGDVVERARWPRRRDSEDER
jgi:hypothetical protein